MKAVCRLLAFLFALALAVAPSHAQVSKATISAEIAGSSAAGQLGGVILNNIVSSYVDYILCTSTGTLYWNAIGTPTCLPIGPNGSFYTVVGGLPVWANTTVSLLATGQAGIGYATGAGTGGAVTQLTSRTTPVTLNNVTGAITLFAAAPVVGTWVSFTVNDTSVAAADVPNIVVKSGTNTYIAGVSAVAAGSFQVSFESIAGTTSDSPVISFAIMKGSVN